MSGANATYIAGFLGGITDVIASGIDGAGWKFADGEWDAERHRFTLVASGQKANARSSVNAAIGSLRSLGTRTSQYESVEVAFTSAALLLRRAPRRDLQRLRGLGKDDAAAQRRSGHSNLVAAVLCRVVKR